MTARPKDWYIDIPWVAGMYEQPRQNGHVSAHREVAAQMLGRALKPGEHVHHRDEVKRNNDPSNLVVFQSNSDHTRYHKTGVMIRMEDGTYTSPANYCACGQLIQKGTERCLACHKENVKSSVMPDKETLERLIWEMPTVQVAKMFGVSDKAVEKWCKKYQITKPARGYWAKHNRVGVG